jgi:hypothetical protein
MHTERRARVGRVFARAWGWTSVTDALALSRRSTDIDPPLYPDQPAMLREVGRELQLVPCRHEPFPATACSESSLGVPPIAGADGVDVDAVVALILDDHGASSEITTAVSTAGGRPVDRAARVSLEPVGYGRRDVEQDQGSREELRAAHRGFL